MLATNTASLPPSAHLTLTPEHMAIIEAGARSISPSWSAFHDSDPNCPSDRASIGATSGGCTQFDVFDTYAIYPVAGGKIELANIRNDSAVLGTFDTVPEAVAVMQDHAAAVRY